MLKHITILSLLILGTIAESAAQIIQGYGFKTGMSMSWRSTYSSHSDRHYSSDPRYGFTLGAYVRMFHTPVFLLSSELNYSQKGQTEGLTVDAFQSDDMTRTVSRDYLTLPILLTLHTHNDTWFVYAGPRIDFLVHSDDHPDPETVDLGATYGLGAAIPIYDATKLSIEVRYSPSYSYYYKSDYYPSQNSCYEFLLGLCY
jgi:hypothetical protein